MLAPADTTETYHGTLLEGAYRVVRTLDHGGMGTVYEAVQLRLNKRVAVKVMARNLAGNAEALARFRREAEVTSAIGHPHIVQVFDFGNTPTGEPFLVMEYLEGEDLEHRIYRLGRLSIEQTVPIVRQTASALAAAHAQGVVHRDLKPANIYLLDIEGEPDFVKVLDFGISKARVGSTNITQSTRLIGTPKYMSSEQAQGLVDDIDGRADQWALACVAWEALSGDGPFAGADQISLLYQIVFEDPAPPLPKVSGLRPEVEAVLRRALSKNRDGRFSSVTDFSHALEAAAFGQRDAIEARASRNRSARSVHTNIEPWKRRRGHWRAAVFGAFAGGLLLGLGLLVRYGPASDATSVGTSNGLGAALAKAQANPEREWIVTGTRVATDVAGTDAGNAASGREKNPVIQRSSRKVTGVAGHPAVRPRHKVPRKLIMEL